jgi:hypothetical protein
MAARSVAGCEAGDAVAACWLIAVLMIPQVIADGAAASLDFRHHCLIYYLRH